MGLTFPLDFHRMKILARDSEPEVRVTLFPLWLLVAFAIVSAATTVRSESAPDVTARPGYQNLRYEEH